MTASEIQSALTKAHSKARKRHIVVVVFCGEAYPIDVRDLPKFYRMLAQYLSEKKTKERLRC